MLSLDKVVSQINSLELKLDWVKERLSCIAQFHSGPSPLDDFYVYKLRQYSFSSNDPELHFNKNIKPITASTLGTIFLLATISQYESFPIRNKKIIVVGEVSSDGLGDYFQMLLTAKYLTKYFPECTIRICTNYKDLTPISDEELKEADLLINIPHGYSPNPGRVPKLRVEEYGFSPDQSFALGLSSQSYKVVGISLTDISSSNLLDISSPLLQQLHEPFYVGYLKDSPNEHHRVGFILTVISSCSNSSQNITIVLPLDKLANLNIVLLKDLGIRQVTKAGEILNIQEKGKDLYIINPFPISNDDWMILLKYSESLIGCTGDMSFTEVISNDKLPFYQIRGHKKEFVDQVIELVGYVYPLPNLHSYWTIIKSTLQETSSDNIYKNCVLLGSMVTPELISECKQFTSIIREYYCANEIIPSLIKRELIYVQYPKLKERDELLFEKWKDDEITLQEACNQIEAFGSMRLNPLSV